MLEKSSKQPNSRSCFLCGRANSIGLKMNWYNDIKAQKVWSELVVPEHFNSYPGVVHGGVVAAILDETSGRAILLGSDTLMVTARLELKYIRPTPTNQPITATGWIIKGGKRGARVAGEICLADGTVTAKCQATIIKPPDGFFESRGWLEEKPFWKVYDD